MSVLYPPLTRQGTWTIQQIGQNAGHFCNEFLAAIHELMNLEAALEGGLLRWFQVVQQFNQLSQLIILEMSVRHPSYLHHNSNHLVLVSKLVWEIICRSTRKGTHHLQRCIGLRNYYCCVMYAVPSVGQV
jgi:hypothetical protein